MPFDWGIRWLECYRGPGHQVQRGKYTCVDMDTWFDLSCILHSFTFVKTDGQIIPKENLIFSWETSWGDFDDVVNTNTTEVTTPSTGFPGTSLRCIFGGVVSDRHFDRHVEKPIETLIGAKRAGTWSDQVQDSSLEQLALISALKWWSSSSCLGEKWS